ncbi:MAG: S41 family peptidase [Phycisphaerae bacterium]
MRSVRCRMWVAAMIGGLALVLVAPATPAAAMDAPVVVKLVPENGATEVDPDTAEIRVTFDREMSAGSHSFCGGGPLFPKFRGRPKWVNRRTVVVKVRLEPEHDYQLGLNCPAAQNFRAADGQPLAPVLWTFSTASRRSKAAQRALNRDSLKELMETLKDEYAYYDRKEIDWHKREKKYHKRIVGSKNTRAWVKHVATLLAPAEDLHLWLEFGGKSMATFRRNVRPNIDLDGVKAILPGLKQENRTVWSARTPDGIGYLLIASWGKDREGDLEGVATILDRFGDTVGLIIDVRANAGGDELLARQVAAWFIDGEKVYARNVYRNAASKTGFGKVLSRSIKGNAPPRRYDRPVRVLMGRACMSSCEAFLLMMKQGRNVKLLGERSFGSSGNPKPHELANRVTVYIPSWKALRPDGTTFEGEGIKPDIEVKASAGSLKKGDPVIRRALKDLGAKTRKKKRKR